MAVSRFLDVPQARKCLILLGFAKPFDNFGGEGGQYSFMLCNTAQLSKSVFVIGLSGDYDVFAIS